MTQYPRPVTLSRDAEYRPTPGASSAAEGLEVIRLRTLWAVALFCVTSPTAADAQTIAAPFNTSYTLFDLGPPPGVPANLGGLTLKNDNPNALLIGGRAAYSNAAIYQIGITRGAGGHITGFSGTGTAAAIAPRIDGGLTYAPNGTLMYTTYDRDTNGGSTNSNQIGQILPGSTTTNQLTHLTPLGVLGSTGALAFVPAGQPGAGQLKVVDYTGSRWYTVPYTPAGNGLYNFGNAVLGATLPTSAGPEGIAYVPIGSPQFSLPSVLIAEWDLNRVSAYRVDANGNPIVGTRQDFITDLVGAEGAFFDPSTGDFLFSTFGGGDRVIRVQGFVPVPEPGAIGLCCVATLGIAARCSRRLAKTRTSG